VELDKPKDRYKGTKFTVIHCDKALDSYRTALASIPAKKRESFTRRMIIQIERLANGSRMTRENFPQEGDLPKRKGQRHKARKFHALKRIPIRGYCWLSEKHENTYFISHYIYKDQNKLDDRDTKIVRSNWSKIEE
jgi:hypothetical protein